MTASIESSRPRPAAFDDTFNRSKTTDERASQVKSPYDDMSYSRSQTGGQESREAPKVSPVDESIFLRSKTGAEESGVNLTVNLE